MMDLDFLKQFIKQAENFPDIGNGIATPVTQKTFKFQKPIQ